MKLLFVDAGGWGMLANEDDPQRFLITDCTSFVLMKERRIRAALTNDRHFVQAGFETFPGS